jgi:NAD(P)-dependent dehydrogenase (short-subunit alcohol dehydrogenase family)
MKTVVITGGSRGIGAAVARKFAAENFRVIIVYRSNDVAAKDLIADLDGDNHSAIKADLSKPQEVKDLFEGISEPVDVLVNSAGIAIPNSIDQNESDWLNSWKDTLDVNLTGLANCCYYAAQRMKKQKSGSIVNVSSRGAFRGEPDMLAYGASKGAVNSLTQSLAKALGEFNISVTAVAPGFVDTDMASEILRSANGKKLIEESPFNRIAKPEEVADTIYFLAGESSRFLSGAIVDVNGASFFRM